MPVFCTFFLLNYFFTVPTKHVWYNSLFLDEKKEANEMLYCYVQKYHEFLGRKSARGGEKHEKCFVTHRRL